MKVHATSAHSRSGAIAARLGISTALKGTLRCALGALWS